MGHNFQKNIKNPPTGRAYLVNYGHLMLFLAKRPKMAIFAHFLVLFCQTTIKHGLAKCPTSVSVEYTILTHYLANKGMNKPILVVKNCQNGQKWLKLLQKHQKIRIPKSKENNKFCCNSDVNNGL